MTSAAAANPIEVCSRLTSTLVLILKESGHPKGDKKADIFYDGEKIPFPDSYFDSVFSSEVFEHVFNLSEILKEINRVLQIQGNLLITIPFAWFEHETPYDFARYIVQVLDRNQINIFGLAISFNSLFIIIADFGVTEIVIRSSASCPPGKTVIGFPVRFNIEDHLCHSMVLITIYCNKIDIP